MFSCLQSKRKTPTYQSIFMKNDFWKAEFHEICHQDIGLSCNCSWKSGADKQHQAHSAPSDVDMNAHCHSFPKLSTAFTKPRSIWNVTKLFTWEKNRALFWGYAQNLKIQGFSQVGFVSFSWFYFFDFQIFNCIVSYSHKIDARNKLSQEAVECWTWKIFSRISEDKLVLTAKRDGA